MTLNEAIAERITLLLAKEHWTPYRLFKESGVSQSTISDILLHKAKGIDVNHLYGFARAFDMTLPAFFSDEIFRNVLDE